MKGGESYRERHARIHLRVDSFLLQHRPLFVTCTVVFSVRYLVSSDECYVFSCYGEG